MKKEIDWESIAWLQKEFELEYVIACHLKAFIRQLLAKHRNQFIETIKKELIEMPTGMFDSTPYKEKLLVELQTLKSQK
jgi:hypothetical protein